MIVPADAVIQRKRVLFLGIGHKRLVGGNGETKWNTEVDKAMNMSDRITRVWERK